MDDVEDWTGMAIADCVRTARNREQWRRRMSSTLIPIRSNEDGHDDDDDVAVAYGIILNFCTVKKQKHDQIMFDCPLLQHEKRDKVFSGECLSVKQLYESVLTSC
jgi:hypothetical protein